MRRKYRLSLFVDGRADLMKLNEILEELDREGIYDERITYCFEEDGLHFDATTFREDSVDVIETMNQRYGYIFVECEPTEVICTIS